MRLNKYGRYVDLDRGNGWFVSWMWSRGFFLICLRPLNWHCYYVRLPMQKWVRRLYIGPFEFELSKYGRSA